MDECLSTGNEPKDAVCVAALPNWRKCVILFIVSWMTLAATFSSTCLFPAIPEIANEFHTTSEAISVSNAGVLLAMGSSSLIWGPIAAVGISHDSHLCVALLMRIRP